ncbi:MAG TPA: hypothetical protein VD788_13585, partial [Candidatus Polarisedimenticolaceae bacterium]|nr:hypothetical protein [Candidatus Polarisedimenticolaceae bacterium]
ALSLCGVGVAAGDDKWVVGTELDLVPFLSDDFVTDDEFEDNDLSVIAGTWNEHPHARRGIHLVVQQALLPQPVGCRSHSDRRRS